MGDPRSVEPSHGADAYGEGAPAASPAADFLLRFTRVGHQAGYPTAELEERMPLARSVLEGARHLGDADGQVSGITAGFDTFLTAMSIVVRADGLDGRPAPPLHTADSAQRCRRERVAVMSTVEHRAVCRREGRDARAADARVGPVPDDAGQLGDERLDRDGGEGRGHDGDRDPGRDHGLHARDGGADDHRRQGRRDHRPQARLRDRLRHLRLRLVHDVARAEPAGAAASAGRSSRGSARR